MPTLFPRTQPLQASGAPSARYGGYHIARMPVVLTLTPSFLQEALFPPVNMVSPVVNRLRVELQTCSWAREGLGGMMVGDEGESMLKSPYEDGQFVM